MNANHNPDTSPDLTTAWVLAANCSLYEKDPGPAQLNIASRIEPHFVSRVEAFRDLYTRLLLEQFDADAARIAALAHNIDTAPRHNATATPVWDIAAELCQRASEIIDTAGAATDTSVRRRLLAGTIHRNRTVVLGQWIPDLQQQLDNELLHALSDDEPGSQESSTP
ncbi:hypothetical protein LAUMK4_05904 [Mycobacterium persicum]|uniref:HD domain-containing protein n=1 Tax=Mycobacterium persicum TaxID=1487726 RepID=A0ABY6RSN5_9MYCO|nr:MULTISPECIES: hypothetical protein [Mycobacterium]KEP40957.1 hypothetical protein MKSMC1_39040 [Mycobacterium kansasii]VBA33224.1 hypothetical protein LAUMK4_05904 [Mycobacterium persicum]